MGIISSYRRHSAPMSERDVLNWKAWNCVTCMPRHARDAKILDTYTKIYIGKDYPEKLFYGKKTVEYKVSLSTLIAFFAVAPLKITLPWLSLPRVSSFFIAVSVPFALFTDSASEARSSGSSFPCVTIRTGETTNKKAPPHLIAGSFLFASATHPCTKPYGDGKHSLIARFMGPALGPSGADRTQVGPMLAPWTLLSG